jgi:hypothetical protein
MSPPEAQGELPRTPNMRSSQNSPSTTFVNRRLQINPIEHRSRTNT